MHIYYVSKSVYFGQHICSDLYTQYHRSSGVIWSYMNIYIIYCANIQPYLTTTSVILGLFNNLMAGVCNCIRNNVFNSDFFLNIVTFSHHYAPPPPPPPPLQFWLLSSELWFMNWGEKARPFSYSCEFISHNSEKKSNELFVIEWWKWASILSLDERG